MKAKSFVYAHSNSNGGHDSVLSLESSFFELRRKVSTNNCPITELFFKGISSFIKVMYHVIANT
jgi:hypothetical protein